MFLAAPRTISEARILRRKYFIRCDIFVHWHCPDENDWILPDPNRTTIITLEKSRDTRDEERLKTTTLQGLILNSRTTFFHN